MTQVNESQKLVDKFYSHMDKYRSAGIEVKNIHSGHDGKPAKFMTTDKDGNKRLHTLTLTGQKVETIERGETDDTPKSATGEPVKRGRGRPAGSKSGSNAYNAHT